MYGLQDASSKSVAKSQQTGKRRREELLLFLRPIYVRWWIRANTKPFTDNCEIVNWNQFVPFWDLWWKSFHYHDYYAHRTQNSDVSEQHLQHTHKKKFEKSWKWLHSYLYVLMVFFDSPRGWKDRFHSKWSDQIFHRFSSLKIRWETFLNFTKVVDKFSQDRIARVSFLTWIWYPIFQVAFYEVFATVSIII